LDTVQKAVCILHAGVEKTGTTSIQRFLRLNESGLAAKRIWIPRALIHDYGQGWSNHILLSTSSRLSLNKPDDLQSMIGLTTMEAVKQHRRYIASRLEEERKSLSFVPLLILVSNEHVHSRLGDVKDLINARDLLAPYSSRFSVVVYLRRQDQLAQSLATMALRHGSSEYRVVPDFSPSHGFDEVLGVNRDYFDYLKLIERLTSVFGEEALVVRLYGKQSLLNGDIIDDFFSSSKIEIDNMVRPDPQNVGFDLEGIGFLLKLNRSRPDKWNPIRPRVLKFLEANHASRFQNRFSLARIKFLEQFDEINEAIREKFFPLQTTLFDEENSDVEPEKSITEIPDDQAQRILQQILKEY
jgi:hypothetical protein